MAIFLFKGIRRLPYAQPTQFWYIVPCVGTVAACIAFYAVLINRSIARTRATLDLIERSESSDYYSKIRKSFRRINEGGVFDRLKDPQDNDSKDLRREVLAYLNHYELVAIGCENKILDTLFYKEWMKTTLINDWNTAEELVNHIRHHDKRPVLNAYVHLEALAKIFASDKIKKDWNYYTKIFLPNEYYNPVYLERERLLALQEEQAIISASSPPTPATPGGLTPPP